MICYCTMWGNSPDLVGDPPTRVVWKSNCSLGGSANLIEYDVSHPENLKYFLFKAC